MQTDGQLVSESVRQTYRQSDGQTVTQTDRQTDGQSVSRSIEYKERDDEEKQTNKVTYFVLT